MASAMLSVVVMVFPMVKLRVLFCRVCFAIMRAPIVIFSASLVMRWDCIAHHREHGHPLLMPIAVVYDPALAVHTPPRLWLASGIKALDHAVESICAKKPDPVCTLMSLMAVRLLAENLPKSKDDPDDLEAF